MAGSASKAASNGIGRPRGQFVFVDGSLSVSTNMFIGTTCCG